MPIKIIGQFNRTDNFRVPTVPTYLLKSSLTAVNEGYAVTFSLFTTNVPAGTSVPITIDTNLDSSDIVGSFPTEFVVGEDETAYVVVTTKEDYTTEGPEYITLSVPNAQPVTVVVNDTSQNPTYVLTASRETVNEGESITYTLTTTNVPVGTIVPITLDTNLNASDITGSFPTEFVVGQNQTATVVVSIREDQNTEGPEYISLGVPNAPPVSVIVNDTSISPTYVLSANATSINEGGSVIITLTSTNAVAGTNVDILYGGTATDADFTTARPTSFVVDASGVTTITLQAKSDTTTEGNETFTISVLGSNMLSITIRDTSLSPPIQPKFTAFSRDGVAYYASDLGTAWARQNTSVSGSNTSGTNGYNTLRNIAYDGNGVWMTAVGTSSYTYSFKRSTDGKTWTTVATPQTPITQTGVPWPYYIPQVVYGNGVFATSFQRYLPSSTTQIVDEFWTSPTGLAGSWTLKSIQTQSTRPFEFPNVFLNETKLAYGNGVWVKPMSNRTASGILYSTDNMTTWQAKYGGNIQRDFHGAKYIDGAWYLLSTGPSIARSTDFTNWTVNDFGTDLSAVFSDIFRANGVYVLLTSKLTNSTLPISTLHTSTDGINWTPRSFPNTVMVGSSDTKTANHMVGGHDGTNFFFMSSFLNGSASRDILYTPDFVTWNSVKLNASATNSFINAFGTSLSQ